MLVWIIVTIFFIWAYFAHASKKRMRDAVANIPGPFCIPLLGAVHKFFDVTPQNFFYRAFRYGLEYGRVIRIWAFNRLVIMSADSELNEQLLASQKHLVKQQNYRMLKTWLGTGLLLSDGQKWFKRRKIITPTFHFKILEQFVDVFDQQSNIFVQQLSKKADGCTPFNIYRYVCVAALDIIAETAMGTKVYAQGDAISEYANAVNQVTKIMAWRFMRIHLNSEIIFTLFYPFLKYRITKYIHIMHEFTTKVIEERRKVLEESLTNNSTNDSEAISEDDAIIGSKKKMALLDVLLQSTVDGMPLSNEDIREEVDTFMFEGHDTTTSALSFVFYLLARHPDVQQKLLNEVIQVIGNDRERTVTLRDLNELKYTECVIKETLRFFPSVPLIGRQLLEDFPYTHSTLGDGVIPAGTEFLMTLHGMMNDPDLFDNVFDFMPERHLDNAKYGAFSFVPFSAGPRNCIGQKFAMLEMKTMVAKAVREYEFLPLGVDVSLELNIVLRSSTGWQLGLKKRV